MKTIKTVLNMPKKAFEFKNKDQAGRLKSDPTTTLVTSYPTTTTTPRK